ARAGLRPALVDPFPFEAQLAPTFDGRSTAVAWSAFRMLKALGVGEALEPNACRMDRILVTDGRRPGAAARRALPAFLRFDADETGADTGGEPLGYMIENRHIRAALAEAVRQAGVTVLAPAAVDEVRVEEFAARAMLKDGRVLSAPLIV